MIPCFLVYLFPCFRFRFLVSVFRFLVSLFPSFRPLPVLLPEEAARTDVAWCVPEEAPIWEAVCRFHHLPASLPEETSDVAWCVPEEAPVLEAVCSFHHHPASLPEETYDVAWCVPGEAPVWEAVCLLRPPPPMLPEETADEAGEDKPEEVAAVVQALEGTHARR